MGTALISEDPSFANLKGESLSLNRQFGQQVPFLCRHVLLCRETFLASVPALAKALGSRLHFPTLCATSQSLPFAGPSLPFLFLVGSAQD